MYSFKSTDRTPLLLSTLPPSFSVFSGIFQGICGSKPQIYIKFKRALLSGGDHQTAY